MARLASVIDHSASQRVARSVTATLARPVQLTEAHVKNPSVLVKQLTNLQQELAASTQVQRSHPEQTLITFEKVVCGISGAKVRIAHNFGVFADFIVTHWSGASGGHSLVSDLDDASAVETDENTLVLRSYVAGIATIRVYQGA